MIVAVLGGGRIGEAVAKCLSESRSVSKVVMTRRNIRPVKHPASSRLRVTTDNKQAAREADLVIIAVKAGDAKAILQEGFGSSSIQNCICWL
jgi:pyrroline-5-carboxylate reductase